MTDADAGKGGSSDGYVTTAAFLSLGDPFRFRRAGDQAQTADHDAYASSSVSSGLCGHDPWLCDEPGSLEQARCSEIRPGR